MEIYTSLRTYQISRRMILMHCSASYLACLAKKCPKTTLNNTHFSHEKPDDIENEVG